MRLNVSPLPSAYFWSLALTDRHRRGFDLRREWTCLCGPCESVSLSHISFGFSVITPPPSSHLPYTPCLLYPLLFLITSHLSPHHLSLSLPLSPLQSDLLYRKCPWPAGTWPWHKPQPPVLLGQLRRWLQGQVLGCPQRSGACQDPGGPLTLVRGLVGGSKVVWERVVSGVGPWMTGPGPGIKFPPDLGGSVSFWR